MLSYGRTDALETRLHEAAKIEQSFISPSKFQSLQLPMLNFSQIKYLWISSTLQYAKFHIFAERLWISNSGSR